MKIPTLRLATLLVLLPLGAFAGAARIAFDTGDVISRGDSRIYGVVHADRGRREPHVISTPAFPLTP